MNPSDSLFSVLAIMVVLAILYAFIHSDEMIRLNPFIDRHLLKRGLDKPAIWLFYDHSDINQREWGDFGSRSSRAIHLPFLNLCYETIVKQNSDLYRIEVISGLSGLAELMGGWEALPPGLQDPLSPINPAEMNWIRTAVLAQQGGLWLSPYSICLKGFGELPQNHSVFFGTDWNENQSTQMPSFHAIWSPRPHHPMFEEWSTVCFERVVAKRGGDQIRRDVNWDYLRFSKEYVGTGIQLDPMAEGFRKKDGKRLQLEDLLASGLILELPPVTVYVPLPSLELRDRTAFGWFLRSSEKQILESDLAISRLFKRGM